MALRSGAMFSECFMWLPMTQQYEVEPKKYHGCCILLLVFG